jgi:hypothetical protein
VGGIEGGEENCDAGAGATGNSGARSCILVNAEELNSCGHSKSGVAIKAAIHQSSAPAKYPVLNLPSAGMTVLF